MVRHDHVRSAKLARSRPTSMPREVSPSSSSIRVAGLTTTPLPMTDTMCGYRTPDGHEVELEDLVAEHRGCGRRCRRPGSARRGRSARPGSRSSCPCPRRPTGARRSPWRASALPRSVAGGAGHETTPDSAGVLDRHLPRNSAGVVAKRGVEGLSTPHGTNDAPSSSNGGLLWCDRGPSRNGASIARDGAPRRVTSEVARRAAGRSSALRRTFGRTPIEDRPVALGSDASARGLGLLDTDFPARSLISMTVASGVGRLVRTGRRRG